MRNRDREDGLSAFDQAARAEWKRHWPLVTATAAGMALAGLLSSVFGVMLGPIEAELGWSRAEISTGPLVVSVMGLFLAAPGGYLIDRWGSRLTGVITVIASFCAIIAMSQVSGPIWQWWAAWSLFGIAGAFTSTVWMAPVSNIFKSARGMAIAVTIAGSSITMAIAPPMCEWLVQNYGWRMAFIVLGCVWCGLTLPLVLLNVPGRKRLAQAEADAVRSNGAAAPQAGGLTPREGFRALNFYLIFIASLLSGLAGLALLLNLAPVLVNTGLSRTEAVTIAGVLGVASLFGRLLAGWLMDTYDIRILAISGGVLSAVFPITLLIAPGVFWAAMIAMVFHGLTGGLRFSAIVYLTSTYLGARSFGLFYGTITTSTTIASGLGPLVANYIYDQTQSYLPTIWAAVPGFLLGAVCFALLRPAPDFTHRAEGR